MIAPVCDLKVVRIEHSYQRWLFKTYNLPFGLLFSLCAWWLQLPLVQCFSNCGYASAL